MARESEILKYLPGILKEVQEFQEISLSENPELSSLWIAVEEVFNDQFINEATENGVKRWESILDISPKGTDSLDVRKFRIISRLNEQAPYTYGTLEQQLKTLCGETGYSLELKNNEYTLIVRVELSAKGKFDEVDGLLSRTVPANIVIDLSLLYNQYSKLNKYTHNKLKTLKHREIREEEL